MNTVFWVRHGENRANITKEFSYKYVDYSLNEKGILQAQQTARYFRDKQIDSLYASPLKRAKETAEIIGRELHMPVMVLEEFREVNIGALELQQVSKAHWDLFKAIINDWRNGELDSCFPDGEDYHRLLERTKQGLNTVLSEKDNARIVIVGHGGMLTFALKHICPEVDLTMIRQTPNHNCSISELTFPEDTLTATLRTWGDFSHLSGEAAQVISGVPKAGEKIGNSEK